MDGVGRVNIPFKNSINKYYSFGMFKSLRKTFYGGFEVHFWLSTVF